MDATATKPAQRTLRHAAAGAAVLVLALAPTAGAHAADPSRPHVDRPIPGPVAPLSVRSGTRTHAACPAARRSSRRMPAPPQVLLVYARAADAPDRSAAFAGVLQAAGRIVQRYVAGQSAGTRTVRLAEACGAPAITSIALPRPAAAYAQAREGRIAGLLRALPRSLRRGRIHALVFVDGLAPGLGGIAELQPEDLGGRPDAGGTAGFVWGPPGMAPDGPGAARLPALLAHELFHLLGAVQPGAPHATPGGHCTDGADLMCYDDGTLPRPLTASCAPIPGPIGRPLDCGGDDYFAISPTPGSWLSRHWNAARSSYLVPCAQQPSACA